MAAPPRSRNLLDWSEVDKCLLILAITFGFAAAFTLMVDLYLDWPAGAPYMNRARWGSHPTPMWIEVALLGAIIAWGLWLRRTRQNSPAYVYLSNQAIFLNNVFYCYMIGYFTTPIGITFLGAAFACFLFFGLRPVYYALGTSLVAMGTMSVLERMGKIPYATMHTGGPFDARGHLYGSWVFAAGAPGLAFTLAIIWLCTVTIARWRRREEQLASAYAELRETKDRLVRAESLAAVGSLVTGAAHELRNPLGSLSSLLQSALEELRTGGPLSPSALGETTQLLERALSSEARARAIIESLYRLSDDLVTEKSRSPLAHALDALARRYPALVIESDAREGGIEIPEGVTRTVLPNLIENALAAGGKGPVRLKVRTPAAMPPGAAAAARPGSPPPAEEGAIEFIISDSGRGISAERRKRIFQPFYTDSRQRGEKGLGLGLYIVHEVITRMGGSIDLKSEEGRGTTVWLHLPAGC